MITRPLPLGEGGGEGIRPQGAKNYTYPTYK